MKATLTAGAVLDFITKDELRELALEFLERQAEEPSVQSIRGEESGVTDGTGACTIVVYTVPLGREFISNRVIVDADGYTPGAPFKNVAGYIDVLRSEERVDFINLATGIPAMSIDEDDTANRFRNGETVSIVIVGGPANTSVRAKVAGSLRVYKPDDAGRVRGTGRPT
jgi:hypothetical protein